MDIKRKSNNILNMQIKTQLISVNYAKSGIEVTR